MQIEEIYNQLCKKMDATKILKKEPMKKHTSFKIGGEADILVKAENIEEIRQVLQVSKQGKVPIYILGNGSNVLIKDAGIRGIVVGINLKKYKIERLSDKAMITAEAGVKLSFLAQELLKQEIAGFEFASRDSWNHRRSYQNECRSPWW